MTKTKKNEKEMFEEVKAFQKRCDLVRATRITLDMSYEERLKAQLSRYGL